MKPTGSVNVEIIATGDELMYGRILDTNSHWLAQRVAELGAKLRRVTMIGDEPETIAAALHDALKRDAHFILFTGGLGPSEDDLTVDSIGAALGRGTVIDSVGSQRIRAIYAKRGIVDEAAFRRGERMARVLENSEPLQNPVGFAVGMCIEEAGKRICTLPGVPAEMKGMFDAHVAPMIQSRATSVFEARAYNVTMVWRDFFTVYNRMQKDYPDVYIKNAATPPVEGEDRSNIHTIKVDLVLEGKTHEEAKAKMDALVEDYMGRIEDLDGGTMELIPSG
jgi:molybdenum cofactor synthesis domain-containing protein